MEGIGVAERKNNLPHVEGAWRARNSPERQIRSSFHEPHAQFIENQKNHWNPVHGADARPLLEADTPPEPPVAQVGNLLYRRLAVGLRWVRLEDRRLPTRLRSELRRGRAETQWSGVRDTADCQSALRFRGSMREICFRQIFSRWEGCGMHAHSLKTRTGGRARFLPLPARNETSVSSVESRGEGWLEGLPWFTSPPLPFVPHGASEKKNASPSGTRS